MPVVLASGAHVYSDAENVVVRAGNGYILIHSGHEDDVNIFLPEKARRVYDTASGKLLAENCDRLTVKIGRNRTVLLRIE